MMIALLVWLVAGTELSQSSRRPSAGPGRPTWDRVRPHKTRYKEHLQREFSIYLFLDVQRETIESVCEWVHSWRTGGVATSAGPVGALAGHFPYDTISWAIGHPNT